MAVNDPAANDMVLDRSSGGGDSLGGWVAHLLEHPDPDAAADLAAAMGALLAFGDAAPRLFPRIAVRAVTDVPVPSDGCCAAAYTAGALAALGELLAAYDDARRVAAETQHHAKTPIPLAARLIDGLARQGPMRRADLARAVDAPPTTVGRTLRRLVASGLVQQNPPATTSAHHDGNGHQPRPALRYSLTSAGTATVR